MTIPALRTLPAVLLFASGCFYDSAFSGSTSTTVVADGGPCVPGGDACGSNGECCSLDCVDNHCAECGQVDAGCATNGDCCPKLNLSCFQQRCSACRYNGSECSLSSDCCSGVCKSDTCVACAVEGEPCSAVNPCCQNYTCDGGGCVP